MARSIVHISLAFAFLLNFAVQVSLVSAQESRAAALAAAAEQLTSIENLNVEYTVTHSSEPGRAMKCKWARSGNRGYWSQVLSPERTIHESYDEKNYFAVSRETSGVSATVFDESEGLQRLGGHLSPESCMGVKLCDTWLSLADVMDDPEMQYDESTNKLSVVSFAEDRAGGALDVEATLDPLHGFLPKEIKITLTGRPATEYLQHWTVDEFMEVPDGRDGKMRWYPKKARLTQAVPNEVGIRIEKISINKPLADSLFTPELPDGAQVLDMTSVGKGGSYVVGGGPELDTRIKDMVDRAGQESRGGVLIALNVLVIVVLAAFLIRKKLMTGRADA
jgi:outer membrane lipoprotein-sorting protein